MGSPKVIGNVLIRQSTYDFLFVFNRDYASILYHFRDMASYLLKFANFDLPHLHLAPPLGVTLCEFPKYFWRQKTTVPRRCLLFLSLAILVEHRLVTDIHTHIQTHDHGIYRESISSRGKCYIINARPICVARRCFMLY